LIKQTIFSILVFSLFLGGCANAPKPHALPPSESLQELCRQYEVQWQLDSVSQGITLSRNGLTAKAMIGSDIVIVGDEKIVLSSPLKRKRHGVVIAPKDFKEKVIDRLVQKTDFTLKKFRTIILDPGHGGKDPGAIGKSGLKEKTIVLDIAKRLQEKLEEKGLHAVMTRDSDEFISLEGRANLANKAKADLFVSIHANSSRARSSRGFEIFYLKNLNDKLRREMLEGTNYKEMFQGLSMKQGDPALEKTLLDMMFVNKQYESKRLAQHLSQDVSDNIDTVDRGSKSAGFFVLKNTLIPAVLVEVGFLSNKNEERLLGTPAYREEVAESLTKSILQYVDHP